MGFLRRQLGVRGGSERHSVLREAGAKPLLFYWAQAITKFYHKARDGQRVGASPILGDALTSDRLLAAGGCEKCWCAEVARALGALDLPGA